MGRFKKGDCVRLKVDHLGIPKGTRGTVQDESEMEPDCYFVDFGVPNDPIFVCDDKLAPCIGK